MENQQAQAKLPGPIQLVRDSWVIYKLRAKTIIGILLILIGLYAIFALLALIANVGLLAIMFALLQAKSSPAIILSLLLLFIAVIIIFGISQTWPFTALLSAITFYREGIGIKESFKRGFKKIIRYYWLILITTFVVLGGMLLFFIPGVILLVWFTLAIFVLISENTGGFSALLKSKEYVQGNFLMALFDLVVLFITSILLQVIFSFVNTFIFSLNLNIFVTVAIVILLIICLAFITLPMSFIYLFLMYDNLKATKGNFAFQPSFRSKLPFIIIALLPILGILLPFVFLALAPKPYLSQPIPTRNSLFKISPSPVLQEILNYVSPDGIWSIQYNPLRSSTPSADATTSFVFTGVGGSCPISLVIYSADNSLNRPLRDYIATNSAYFGDLQEETLIGGSPAIKSGRLTEQRQNIFYTVEGPLRFFILTYSKTLSSSESAQIDSIVKNNCKESEKYIESVISSFKLESNLNR